MSDSSLILAILVVFIALIIEGLKKFFGEKYPKIWIFDAFLFFTFSFLINFIFLRFF